MTRQRAGARIQKMVRLAAREGRELPRLRHPAPDMVDLDRLEWRAGLALMGSGVRVGVRARNPETLERALEYFPEGWRASSNPVVQRLYSLVGFSSPGSPEQVFADERELQDEVEGPLQALETDLTLFVISSSTRRICLHAGVVGWRDRAIVIPGASYSGKTTLVSALLRAGATYYSDELAILDRHGHVHPFPRRLMMRPGTGLPRQKTAAESFGAGIARRPIPVGMVVLTSYQQNARWCPERLSPGQAVLRMLEHGVAATRNPRMALAVLGSVATNAVVFQGVRGDADATATLLLDNLENSVYA